MARFHWNHELDHADLEQRSRVDSKRQVMSGLIEDGHGDKVSDLSLHYPWLSPGVMAAMTKLGVPHDSPAVRAAADLEFQRRTRQDDWTQPGDDMKAPGGETTVELFGEVTDAAQEEGS